MAEMAAMHDRILGCARDNDVEQIKALLKMGCPPTYANRVGQSALHIGAIWGCVDAVKVLLEAKANPNHKNSLRGSTPLHAAAMGRGPADKRAQVAKVLIEYKANPNLPDNTGELPHEGADSDVVREALGAKPLLMHKAVEARNPKALEAAIDDAYREAAYRAGDPNMVPPLEVADRVGNTALHAAVEAGWKQGCELLIQAKANVDERNNSMQVPLHKAVLRGDHSVVQLLLDSKSDIAAQDRDLESDFRQGRQEPSKHRTPLHNAAMLGSAVMVQMMLKAAGSNAKKVVNIPDLQSQTALHMALELREKNASDLEVGSGVRVFGLKSRPTWNDRLGTVAGSYQGTDSSASTANGSRTDGRWPILVDVPDCKEPVLLKADNLALATDETLNLLLEAGADVNLGSSVTGESRTLLHMAAFAGDAELTERVLKCGAVVDSQDKAGFSALHFAARGKHTAVARRLLDAKAALTLANTGGKTPLALARTNGAGLELLALLGDSDAEAKLAGGAEAVPESPKADASPQTIEELTPEQRALLFMD
eukprot:TRINITY_DN50740_c0_g1_i1.p1 TRINITY_DN50740_c0_g1~~TRINITY_DN50740_c0_g1_i1.p1  ORF type:complete len:539 (-),score=149.58 TRINITY_DN50740_c0_g1_i1:124-1740(-)